MVINYEEIKKTLNIFFLRKGNWKDIAKINATEFKAEIILKKQG